MKVNSSKLEMAKAKACMRTKEIIAAGIAKGTYNNIRAEKNVKASTVGKLAKILDCDVTDILAD